MCASSTAAGPLKHRHTELGTAVALRVHRKRQVRDGQQVQAAVVNAKNVVANEVQALDVTLDLGIRGRMPEAQVAVLRFQGQQVRGDALAVAGAQGADRNGEVKHGQNFTGFP